MSRTKRVDVLVAGSSLLALGLAEQLAADDYDVCVVDDRPSRADTSTLLLPPEAAPNDAVTRLALASRDFFESPPEGFGVGRHPNGSMQLIGQHDRVQRLLDHQDLLRKLHL